MTHLTPDAISSYRHDGYFFPLKGIGADSAREARIELERYEQSLGGKLTELSPHVRYKLHVKLPWAHAVATMP